MPRDISYRIGVEFIVLNSDPFGYSSFDVTLLTISTYPLSSLGLDHWSKQFHRYSNNRNDCSATVNWHGFWKCTAAAATATTTVSG
jgi:hypothetical protein